MVIHKNVYLAKCIILLGEAECVLAHQGWNTGNTCVVNPGRLNTHRAPWSLYQGEGYIYSCDSSGPEDSQKFMFICSLCPNR